MVDTLDRVMPGVSEIKAVIPSPDLGSAPDLGPIAAKSIEENVANTAAAALQDSGGNAAVKEISAADTSTSVDLDMPYNPGIDMIDTKPTAKQIVGQEDPTGSTTGVGNPAKQAESIPSQQPRDPNRIMGTMSNDNTTKGQAEQSREEDRSSQNSEPIIGTMDNDNTVNRSIDSSVAEPSLSQQSETIQPKRDPEQVIGTMGNDNTAKGQAEQSRQEDRLGSERILGTMNNDNTTNGKAGAEGITPAQQAVEQTKTGDLPAVDTQQPRNTDRVIGTMNNDNTAKGRAEQAEEEGRTLPTQQDVEQARIRLLNMQQTSAAEMFINKDMDPKTGKPFENEDAARTFRDSEVSRLQGLSQSEVVPPSSTETTTNDEDIPDVESTTPEQSAEEAKKAFEDAAVDFYAGMFGHGNENLSSEALAKYNDKLSEYVKAQPSAENRKLAQEFVKGLLNPEKAANPRETAKMKHIREKLQELGNLEMQLRVQAETIKKMHDQEKDLKEEVNAAEAAYVNESNPDEKQKKLAVFSGKAMHLAGYQDAIKLQKGLGRDLMTKRRQVRGYIHRKLGTHSVGYNLVFGAGTALTQGGAIAANSFEAIFDFE